LKKEYIKREFNFKIEEIKMGKKETKEHKENISKSMKRYYSSPLARKKRARIMNRFYSNPLERKRWSRIMKEYCKRNPQFVRKVDRSITKWWREHRNVKKEMSIRAKNLFISNPEKFKKFIKYGNNPASPRFKTRQGFKVRSRGEQEIANFLFKNKIQSQYETKPLIFREEGQICVPDFWLPKFKMYIEYYGGYPAAWKKKVLKNILYKTHKIPVISITPGELRDLGKYLVGEIK
jgi:hypothetical protein